MKLKNMPKAELEVLSYTDLSYLILKENKKTMNTSSVFKIICDLLAYTDEEYTDKIGDYYTALALDKRFVLLDNTEWALREHKSIELSYDDDDDEYIDADEEEEEEEVPKEVEEDVDSINDDEDLDDDDDDEISLTIVNEEDLDEEM